MAFYTYTHTRKLYSVFQIFCIKTLLSSVPFLVICNIGYVVGRETWERFVATDMSFSFPALVLDKKESMVRGSGSSWVQAQWLLAFGSSRLVPCG